MNRKTLKRSSQIKMSLFGFTIVLLCFFFTSAKSFESTAKSVLVVDNLTGTILLDNNAHKRIPPASMSKLMTLYMVFDALRDNRILLTDTIRVSKNASQKGGSKMFLNNGQKVSIENIIRGIIVHSGNDACIAIAETLSGTEEEFARDMNTMAKKIGLVNSSFTNSTGWPDDNHFMSAIDLAHIATRLRLEFPDYYGYFSEKNFTWNEITQNNRNPMLNKGIGADGLKTGHTEAAGYGLVGSAKRGNRRITFVVSGMKTSKERTIESEKLINWAYRDFKAERVVQKNQEIGRIPVWLGNKKEIALAPNEDIFILVPTNKNSEVKASISYKYPITAPFDIGERSPAKLQIIYKLGSKNFSKTYDLFTLENSEPGTFLGRIYASIIIFKNYLKSAIQ